MEKIMIINTRSDIKSIEEVIDLDDVKVEAYFENNTNNEQPINNILGDVIYKLEDFPLVVESIKVDYYLFFVGYEEYYGEYHPIVTNLGIDENRMVLLQPFTDEAGLLNIMYFSQWEYLMQNKPRLDFISTGSSVGQMGLDLTGMMPFKGVKLERGSQDLYYGFKMAEVYFKKCVPINHHLLWG